MLINMKTGLLVKKYFRIIIFVKGNNKNECMLFIHIRGVKPEISIESLKTKIFSQ